TPLDTWAQGVRLPRLVPGDLVAVPNVGAYGLTARLLAVQGHRPPVEVVVDSAPLTVDPGTRDLAGAGAGQVVSVTRLALVREHASGRPRQTVASMTRPDERTDLW
nr:hypothetical protein [Micromonospora sp. DSM 115978]